MPITVQWDDAEETIIRYDILGQWSWNEYYPVMQNGTAMINAKAYRVDAIADFSRSIGLPGGAMTKTREALNNVPDHCAYTVFAGGNMIINTVTRTFTRIYPREGARILIASDLDDARHLIARYRQAGRLPALHGKTGTLIGG